MQRRGKTEAREEKRDNSAKMCVKRRAKREKKRESTGRGQSSQGCSGCWKSQVVGVLKILTWCYSGDIVGVINK
jgi:hypothetical protein